MVALTVTLGLGPRSLCLPLSGDSPQQCSLSPSSQGPGGTSHPLRLRQGCDRKSVLEMKLTLGFLPGEEAARKRCVTPPGDSGTQRGAPTLLKEPGAGGIYRYLQIDPHHHWEGRGGHKFPSTSSLAYR